MNNRLFKLFHKERGFRVGNDFTYDFALIRLRVAQEDSWKGITPSYYSSDFNPEPPIFAARFAECPNYRHILALASEDGKVAIQNTNIRNYDVHEKALEGQQCHFNAVFDVAWDPGQMKLVSASGDHTARLWDVTESCLLNCRVFKGHVRSVKTAVFRKNDSAVFASGGRDGAILIWDTRDIICTYLSPRADNCIFQGHPGPFVNTPPRKRNSKVISSNTSGPSSITGLVFQDDNTLISCGAGDGIIKVWDLRRNYTTFKGDPIPKYSLPHMGQSTFKGFTNLVIDEAGKKLYASCMDNKIYCYSLTSYSPKPIKTLTGLLNNTFYIKSSLSPDGNYLISGSSDEKAYIWNLKKDTSSPLLVLNGHNVEVTCVAWSGLNDTRIVTCSDDARHKIWRIGPEKIEDYDDELYYKGNAEYYEKLPSRYYTILDQLNDIGGCTPRSMQNFVAQNERTPCSSKRTFSQMNNDDDDDGDGGARSSNSNENRTPTGRTLFTPLSSSSSMSTETQSSLTNNANLDMDDGLRLLDGNNENVCSNDGIHSMIFQDNIITHYAGPYEPFMNKTSLITQNSLLLPYYEDEFRPFSPQPSTSTSNNMQQQQPNQQQETQQPNKQQEEAQLPNQQQNLTQQKQQNQNPSTSLAVTSQSSPPQNKFCPTLNLPNYVLTGEAPHLHIMSPKRTKNRDNVDWLTKLRKCKLSSASRLQTIKEKLNDTDVKPAVSSPSSSTTSSSPSAQHNLRLLRDCNGRNNSHGHSRSRTSSRSGSTDNRHNKSVVNSPTTSTTPKARRRNSETSILRYLTVTSPLSSRSSQQTQLQQSLQQRMNSPQPREISSNDTNATDGEGADNLQM